MADPKVNILFTATDKTKGVLSGIGSALGNLGKVALGVAAAGLGAFSVAAVKGVQAASNLEETINKSNVIFGDAAGAVQKFAETAATSLGQSQQSALDAAATFGVFGKAAGLTGADLAKFSIDFTGLASDLASFSNTSPEEAILAIGAALRGESEPLRRYGVLLDDATLREKALELGIISTTKDALTPQQRVLAAQALIYAQTSDAQGDFARTSEGLANSQRIVRAQVANLSATFGKMFLPIAQKVFAFLSKNVMPVLSNLVFALQDAGLFSEEFTQALANIVGDKNAERIISTLKTIYDWLRVQIPIAIQTVSRFWTAVLQPAMMAVWNWMSSVLIPFIQNVVVPWLSALFTPELTARISGFITSLQPVWTAIQNLVAAFVASGPAIKTAVENIISSIKATLGSQGPGIIENFTGIINSIAELWRQHGDEIIKIVSTAIQLIGVVLIGGTQFISGLINGFLKGLTGDWQGAWNTIKKSTETFANAVMVMMGTTLGQVRQIWAKNLEMLVAIVILLWQKMFNAGKNIVAGLKAGIQSQWASLVSWLKGQIAALVAMVEKALKIKSPSGVFAKIGSQMMAGMAQGIQSSMSLPNQALGGSVSGAVGSVGGGGGRGLFIGTQNITIMDGSDVDEIMETIRQANQQSMRVSGSFGYAG